MTERDSWFEANRLAIETYYLADSNNPYQQSGRTTGAARWEETRRPIANAVHRTGSFLDVGCANGLLLETVAKWVEERGITIEPHGIDFVDGVLELARQRVPDGTFHLGNAWAWEPPQRYTFVRTNLEYVPPEDRASFVLRQHRWVEPGGRMILCYYPDRSGAIVDVPGCVADVGLELGGVLRPTDHTIVWLPA